MKKLSLLLVLSAFSFFGLQAQECSPDPNCVDVEAPGEICPLVFDTAYVNHPYNQVLTFIPPATYNYNGQNLTVQKIVINNVTDLPQGITWAANAAEFIPTTPPTSYCAVMYGTPTTAGDYPFHLSATVTVMLGFVPIPVPVTEQTLNYTPIIIVRPENEAPPVAEFTASATTANIGEDITFTDQSYNATSWMWEFEGAVQPTSNAQNPVVKWNTEGTYNVTLTVVNENGASPKYDTYLAENYITINNTNSINSEFSKLCSIYPNPTTGIINIEGSDIKSVSIYNSVGQEIYKSNNKVEFFSIDLSKFERGSYIVNVVTGKGNVSRGITLE